MENNKPIVSVIGSGVSGLVAACNLAQNGYKVILLEKNNILGGRLYSFEKDNFIIKNGPSWYWMPDIFNTIFKKIGIKEKLNLKKLDPQYKLIFKNNNNKYQDLNIYNNFKNKFLKYTKEKYNIFTKKYFFYKNQSIFEYFSLSSLYDLIRFRVFRSYNDEIDYYLDKDLELLELGNLNNETNDKINNNNEILLESELQQKLNEFLMKWPCYFIGSDPKNIPSIYSILTYSMLKDGTYIPLDDGMDEIIKLLEKKCIELGIEIIKNADVCKFEFEDNKIIGLEYEKKIIMS